MSNAKLIASALIASLKSRAAMMLAAIFVLSFAASPARAADPVFAFDITAHQPGGSSQITGCFAWDYTNLIPDSQKADASMNATEWMESGATRGLDLHITAGPFGSDVPSTLTSGMPELVNVDGKSGTIELYWAKLSLTFYGGLPEPVVSPDGSLKPTAAALGNRTQGVVAWTSGRITDNWVVDTVAPAAPTSPCAVPPNPMVMRGPWSPSQIYAQGDAVIDSQQRWLMANRATTVNPVPGGGLPPHSQDGCCAIGSTPSHGSDWMVLLDPAALAAQGATGPQGPAGPQGQTGAQGPAGASGSSPFTAGTTLLFLSGTAPTGFTCSGSLALAGVIFDLCAYAGSTGPTLGLGGNDTGTP